MDIFRDEDGGTLAGTVALVPQAGCGGDCGGPGVNYLFLA